MDVGGKLEKPVIITGDYVLKNKSTFPHIGYHLKDLASLYMVSDGMERQLKDLWEANVDGSEYFPVRFRDAVDARQKIKNFTFSNDLRNKAAAGSRKLMHLLKERSAPRTVYRQPIGKFDPRASGRLLTSVRNGNFNMDEIRPFKQVNRTAPNPPHVGIMAAGNWSTMWNDVSYIPSVGILTMIVGWASEILGCKCTAALGRNVEKSYGQKNHLGLVYLYQSEYSTPLNAFCALMHREIYRMGITYIELAHPFHLQKTLQDTTKVEQYYKGDYDYNEHATENFDGVKFLKSQGATITISIGDFADAKDADIVIGQKYNIENAINKIAEQLLKNKTLFAA